MLVAPLPALTAHLVQLAVDYDRSTGIAWDEIGKWLHLHPDTARSRYGRPSRWRQVRRD